MEAVMAEACGGIANRDDEPVAAPWLGSVNKGGVLVVLRVEADPAVSVVLDPSAAKAVVSPNPPCDVPIEPPEEPFAAGAVGCVRAIQLDKCMNIAV